MISRTKYKLTPDEVKALFTHNGIAGVTDVAPLGAGEYNAVFCATGPDQKEYAIKIAPSSAVAVMTMEKNMMAAELFWYQKIREHTSIRVPEVYATDFTKEKLPADYFIMEKLNGTQLDQTEFTDAEKMESTLILAKMAAEVHTIKNDRFGYVQNGLYDTWYLAIRSMVSAILADCSRMHRRTPRGELLLRLIDKHKAVLEKAECCMVNFDLWPPNVLCSYEAGILHYAWLDPERSFWGDRICDFVCLETMLPLEKKKASLEAYNAAAQKPILADKDERIRYAVGLGYLALIMETEKYYRYTPIHYGWWRNVSASSVFYKQAFSILEYEG
jgi:aminoglycoside phosphotransferase (APT) family kinase protein